MAYGINYSAQDVNYTRSTINGYYGGYGGVPPEPGIQTRAASTLNVSLDGRWQVLDASIGDIRRAMVEKYQVDF